MIVLATANQGKVDELRRLSPPEFAIRDLLDVGITLDGEVGETFLENARIKAWSIARHGYIALADDSGLEVDALDGLPGVWSSRFAGPDATDSQNNEKLLQCLSGVSTTERSARFRSLVILASKEFGELIAEGTIQGRIVEVPRGSHGFGYDPLFEIQDANASQVSGMTMAELSSEQKNEVSHRARAYRALINELQKHPALMDVIAKSLGSDAWSDGRGT